MARTQKPLKILIHPSLNNAKEIEELIAKGHDIQIMTVETDDFDIVLSPKAWRILPGMEKYIDIAVKAARIEKYPKKEKA